MKIFLLLGMLFSLNGFAATCYGSFGRVAITVKRHRADLFVLKSFRADTRFESEIYVYDSGRKQGDSRVYTFRNKDYTVQYYRRPGRFDDSMTLAFDDGTVWRANTCRPTVTGN